MPWSSITLTIVPFSEKKLAGTNQKMYETPDIGSINIDRNKETSVCHLS